MASNPRDNLSYATYFLPLIAVLTWVGNVIVAKLAIGHIEAWSLSFYRWGLAFLVLTPFMLIKVWRQRDIVISHLFQLAILGVFGMVAYQGLVYEAAHTTNATNIGILNAMIPVITLIIAIFILKEKPSVPASIGVILSVIGISILIGKGNPLNILAGDFHIGDVLVIIGVICYAVYGVLTRFWQMPLDLLTNIYIQIFFAILCQIPIVFYTGLSPLTGYNLGLIAYTGIFPSLLAPLVWTKSIQLIGASQTSIFLNLMPICTALVAVFYLHESWQSYHTLGTLMILAGVGLAQIKLRKKSS